MQSRRRLQERPDTTGEPTRPVLKPDWRFSKFDDPKGYAGERLTLSYWLEAYLQFGAALRAFWTLQMASIVALVVSIDHTFKYAKHVTGSNGGSAVNATLTVCSEFGQVMGIYHDNATDYTSIRPHLEGIARRCGRATGEVAPGKVWHAWCTLRLPCLSQCIQVSGCQMSGSIVCNGAWSASLFVVCLPVFMDIVLANRAGLQGPKACIHGQRGHWGGECGMGCFSRLA